ncbi:MAG: hypothetical protein HQL56_07510 [Magnetococcales bacterium]|nr:hypothetical protein [Magnetococcales bacterium]
MRHPLAGLLSLSHNWLRFLWAIDSRQSPELVPGLHSRNTELSVPSLVKMIQTETWDTRLLGIIFLPFVLIPAFFYRWSLKSTCWLYLPLVFLFRRPKWDAFGPTRLVQDLHDSRPEQLRRSLSWLALISLAASTFSKDRIDWLHTFFSHAHPLSYLWVFDLGKLAPWQWGSLVNILLTALVYFYSERAFRDMAFGQFHHTTKLLYLARIRTILTVIVVLLTVGYVVIDLEKIDLPTLPGWLQFLNALYGNYLH